MKVTHLNLYARFFLLFILTTIFLVVFILLGSFALSEDEAEGIVFERKETLHGMLLELASGPIDIDKLKQEAKKNRVRIQIKRGSEYWRTGSALPEHELLLKNAKPLGNFVFC